MGNRIHELLQMRKQLFFDCPTEELRREIEENRTGAEHPYYEDVIIFVYEKADGTLGGFVEISAIRTDKIDNFSLYAEYCADVKIKSTLPRLEAWYVNEELRCQKIGMTLVKAAEGWAVEKCFHMVLSDTDTFRNASILAHQSMGYEVVAQIPDKELVLFLKRLVQE